MNGARHIGKSLAPQVLARLLPRATRRSWCVARKMSLRPHLPVPQDDPLVARQLAQRHRAAGVLIATSAPNPNWPPSVKRVLAFT